MSQRTEKSYYGMATFVVMRDPELTLREKALYAYLCTYASAEKDSTWVSINTMANECGISQSSVSRILDKLIKKGVIKRTFRGKGESLLTTVLK
jgi:DNA-binding MarR family transcriptional regulator